MKIKDRFWQWVIGKFPRKCEIRRSSLSLKMTLTYSAKIPYIPESYGWFQCSKYGYTFGGYVIECLMGNKENTLVIVHPIEFMLMYRVHSSTITFEDLQEILMVVSTQWKFPIQYDFPLSSRIFTLGPNDMNIAEIFKLIEVETDGYFYFDNNTLCYRRRV